MEPRAGGVTDPRGSRGGSKQSSPGALVAVAVAVAVAAAARRGARRPGLGSRSPTCTRTRTRIRTAGPCTRPGGSQESPGSCATGVCPGHWGHLGTQGRGLSLPAGPRARQLLARLDARPLAARAAADVAALVRRTGATLRLRPKAAINVLESADIEVTDSRLPNATFVDHRSQHHRSETLGTGTAPPQVTQNKARSASKPLQASGRFYVELVRGSAGFGLTLSGGQDSAGDTPLAVRGLLKDGPAQRCGRLQVRPGDLVLHLNGEPTQGLTHAQVVERIRAGGPRLRLVLSRPLETHPGKPEGMGGTQKGDAPGASLPRSTMGLGSQFPILSPNLTRSSAIPRSQARSWGPEVMKSRSASASPRQHPLSRTMAQTQGSPEPSPEGAADCPAVPPPERRTEDPDDRTPGSPGPWLVPSEERLSRALGVPGAAQLALEMAAGRRRH